MYAMPLQVIRSSLDLVDEISIYSNWNHHNLQYHLEMLSDQFIPKKYNKCGGCDTYLLSLTWFTTSRMRNDKNNSFNYWLSDRKNWFFGGRISVDNGEKSSICIGIIFNKFQIIRKYAITHIHTHVTLTHMHTYEMT